MMYPPTEWDQHQLHGSLVCLAYMVFVIAGFAFVYFEDERDAEDAIRYLDNTPFGYDRRRLSVEWARVCLVVLSFHSFSCVI